MRGGKVVVHRLIDGRLRVTYKERVLALTPYRTYPVPKPVEDEKTLDARIDSVLAAARTAQPRMSRGGGGLKPSAYGGPLRGVGA